ncbi:MAG TPA: Crp/Fnr family transcriptional regulator [Solirubrobacteraceae bacterium]|nr:Crp/Fnr family transcriptional regulator [Solirubrobacteraceae bacterium]
MTESFLAKLSPDELSGFRAAGRTRRFGQGEMVFREGDDAGGVMAIVSGRMKVSVAGVGGREVVLQFPGPGDLVGELSPIFRRPRSASVVAMGDVEVIAIPAEGFRRFIADRPRVAMLILDHVASLLSVADRQRVDLATRDVTSRIAARLLELADEADVNANGPSTLSLALSQDELAAWTGASREAVAKSLHVLRELGWVQTGRREITVLDRTALRSLVG